MFKKLLLCSILIFAAIQLMAVEKSDYDISMSENREALQKSTGPMYTGKMLQRHVSEITLLQGGYFTIGTNEGRSELPIDDRCGITFGHPYALTSYPLIAFDGQWGKADQLFDVYQSVPVVSGDSLLLEYSEAGKYQFQYTIRSGRAGEDVYFTMKLKNLDTESHSFGCGLVFDPGLGKKGDGWASVNGQDILQDQSITGEAIPQQLVLKERTGGATGMKTMFDFSLQKPEKIIFANWHDIVNDDSPDFTPSLLRELYDLTLKIFWPEQQLAAGEELICELPIEIAIPEIGEQAFMRWDMTRFLSLENNVPFPKSLNTFVEIYNADNSSFTGDLSFTFPDQLFSNRSDYNFSVSGNDFHYQRVSMQAKELYEDAVVEVGVDLKKNGLLIDSFMHHVFIPAVPMSDTGLVCTIDSLITSRYPEISLLFEVLRQKTGQRITNLSNENIFLYENDQRIREFSLSPDTTGGVTAADVVFVLDCSGSMGDDIDAVRNNIGEFADSLVARNIDLQLGVVTFSTTIDEVHDFTSNVEEFKSWLAGINLWGGRENSLGALYQATQLSFRENSKRTIVWITDEDYPVAPEINLTVQDVVNQLLLYGITVHSIGLENLKTLWSNPIIEPTGGNWYNIQGNFRDILLDISRMRGVSKLLLSYNSPGAVSGSNTIMLEIHYAGLGGTTTITYEHSTRHLSEPALQCFPNPFNPIVQIMLNHTQPADGVLEIYNILGQRVKLFPLRKSDTSRIIEWNARDLFDQPVAAGTYFVQLKLFNDNGKIAKQHQSKILYLK